MANPRAPKSGTPSAPASSQGPGLPSDIQPARTMTAGQVQDAGPSGAVFAPQGPPAPEGQPAAGPGINSFEIGGLVRGRGRRPRSEMWAPHLRTQQRFEGAARNIRGIQTNIGALGRAQMQAASQGLESISRQREEARERLNERRREMERGYGDYLSAVQEVEDAADLDPGRVWARTDTPARILAGLAMGGQIAARAFGRNMENGPMEHFQALIRQDLELQQEEYRRGVRRADMRRGVYGIMRQRFGDEQVAADMAEAVEWRQVARQIDAFGRQIQNEQTRAQLERLGAQAGQAADQAALRGLQARQRELARSRGGARRVLTYTAPGGERVTTTIPERQFQSDLRTMMRNEAQVRGRMAQAAALAQGRGDSGATNVARQIFRTHGPAAIPGARNIIDTQNTFRDAIREAAAQARANGDPTAPSEQELAGANPLRALIGDGRIRGWFVDYLEGGGGQRLRQNIWQSIFNAIKAQSGAQFTDREFERRLAIAMSERQEPEGILTGIGILADMQSGPLEAIQMMDPQEYARLLRNGGITEDPIQVMRDNQDALQELFGQRESGHYLGRMLNWAQRAAEQSDQFDMDGDTRDARLFQEMSSAALNQYRQDVQGGARGETPESDSPFSLTSED